MTILQDLAKLVSLVTVAKLACCARLEVSEFQPVAAPR